MVSRVSAPVSAALIALLVAGCSAPKLTAATTTGTASLDVGAAVYADRCSSCHGTDLRGTDKGPSHLSKVYEPGHHNDLSFRKAIATGSPAHHWSFGDMAPVPGLSEDEIVSVIAYVRSVQQREGFEPYTYVP